MSLRPLAAATLLALIPALVLCGCARKIPLEPAVGQALPPAPYGSQVPLSSVELLELAPLAAPDRNVELRRESEVREDDPFDLPPEG